MDFSARLWIPYACLTSPIPRVTYVPFDSKRIRLASKSTPPPYFKIQLRAYYFLITSLLRPLTSIQQLRVS
jgi:hypothetical protein